MPKCIYYGPGHKFFGDNSAIFWLTLMKLCKEHQETIGNQKLGYDAYLPKLSTMGVATKQVWVWASNPTKSFTHWVEFLYELLTRNQG